MLAQHTPCRWTRILQKVQIGTKPPEAIPRAQAKKHMHMHAKSEKNPCPHENTGNKWGGGGEALIPQFLAHLLMHDAYSETRNLSIYSV